MIKYRGHLAKKDMHQFTVKKALPALILILCVFLVGTFAVAYFRDKSKKQEVDISFSVVPQEEVIPLNNRILLAAERNEVDNILDQFTRAKKGSEAVYSIHNREVEASLFKQHFTPLSMVTEIKKISAKGFPDGRKVAFYKVSSEGMTNEIQLVA